MNLNHYGGAEGAQNRLDSERGGIENRMSGIAVRSVKNSERPLHLQKHLESGFYELC